VEKAHGQESNLLYPVSKTSVNQHKAKCVNSLVISTGLQDTICCRENLFWNETLKDMASGYLAESDFYGKD
jgi:hypothetical protein